MGACFGADERFGSGDQALISADSTVNFAIHQALQGQDVLLLDSDEQGTARTFTALRADLLGAPGYTAVSLHGPEISTPYCPKTQMRPDQL
jgi:hypothetical protein